MWTLQQAVELATEVESICPNYGFHVGLTGGCLYKGGERKDCDLVFYRIRQDKNPDYPGLFVALKTHCGFQMVKDFGFVVKFWKHSSIDCLFP
jgi:hypothetical protein